MYICETDVFPVSSEEGNTKSENPTIIEQIQRNCCVIKFGVLPVSDAINIRKTKFIV